MIFPKETTTPDQAIVHAARQLEERVEELETELADLNEITDRMAEVLMILRPRMQHGRTYIGMDLLFDDDPGYHTVKSYFNLGKEKMNE